MIKKENEENYQFRILYFIGIILIVAGHCNNGSMSLFYEWFPIYSFHLALFVFVSGYFFIKNREKPFLVFMKKIFTKFIIPLYLWNLFYGILALILRKYGFNFGVDLSFKSLVLLPIYNGHQFVFNLSSWFIFPLIIIQFINYFIIKLIGKREKLFYIYFAISLLLGFLGVYLSISGYNQGYMLLVDKVLYFFPFFSLGLLYKQKLESKDKVNNIIYFGTIFIISYIVIYLFKGARGYVPSWCQDFDNIFRPFFVGIVGIAFWLRISRILVPSLKNSRVVMYVAKNTFSIMMHHLTGFFIINTIWFFISKYTNIANNFDINLYKSDIFYHFLPRNLSQISFFYIIFAIAFSLLVGFLLDKFIYLIKKFLSKNKKETLHKN